MAKTMAKKRTPKKTIAPKDDTDKKVLALQDQPGRTRSEILADDFMKGDSQNGITAMLFGSDAYKGELSVTACVHALESQIRAVQEGDLRQVEAMLFGQASALSAIFHECARRSVINMGEYPEAMERYMRLAMRAQSQCRTTLEALVEAKHPKSVAFVRQANIANGHQQVNNGDPRAGQLENPPNELQEAFDGRPVAEGAQAARGGADQGSATVVEIDRAANARRQG